MTPEQIKAFAKQAGGTEIINGECIAFTPDELAEFVRLVRADDEALLHQALEILEVKWNGVAEVPHLFNVSRVLRKRLEGV